MRVEVAGLVCGLGPSTAPTVVLQQFDLTVASGEIHAVVGRSGCGKTTLLRALQGTIQPLAGSVRFVGQPRYRNATAMVYETPRLLPWWTVERNVGIGLEFSQMPRALYERVVDFYTSHVGLGRGRSRLPNSLSLGQQSRAGLARALAHDADVLLMDEPFAHLDALARRRIHGELEAILRADGRTMIFTTHDIEEAVLLADRITVMRSHPGPVVEVVDVGVARPRVDRGLSVPALRAATAHVWDALERS